MKQRLAALALCGLVAAGGLAGCGDDADASGTAGKKVKALDVSALGRELSGLTVQKEDVAGNIAKVDAAFVDGVALYSLRAENLVQASLQVSRFIAEGNPGEEKFRDAVINQIGATTPRPFRLGDHTVYLTTGTKQSIAVWFRDKYMFILASRSDYEEPRTLLRQALELEP